MAKLFVISFCLLFFSAVAWGKKDQCVMYDCGLDSPCVYNGTSKILNNATSVLQLQHYCATSNYTLGSRVCCSPQQINTMYNQLSMLAGLFKRCPSCMNNAAKSVCQMVCGPDQSDYLLITNTTARNKTKALKFSKEVLAYETFPELDEDRVVSNLSYFISEAFVSASFESCKNVLMPQGNIKAMMIACGAWGDKCNGHHWYEYMGNNPFVPFIIVYHFYDTENATYQGETYVVRNDSTVPCYKPLEKGGLACSCADCPCDVPPYPTPPSPFTLFGVDAWVVIMSIVFGMLLIFITAGFVVHVYYREYRDDILRGPGLSDNYDSETYPPVSSSSKTEPSWIQKWSAKFDARLCSGFTWWGHFCCRHPVLILISGAALVAGLSSGLLYFTVTSDPVDLWAIPNSKGLLDKEYFDTNFRPFFRTEQVIITASDKETQILGKEFLKEVFELQKTITDLVAKNSEGATVRLPDICYSPMSNGYCTIQSVPNWFQNNETLLDEKNYMDHIKSCADNPFSPADTKFYGVPCLGEFGGPAFPFVALGGYSGKEYLNATALILTFLVNNHADKSMNENATAWEAVYVEFMRNYNNSKMDIAYTSERSIEDELNRESRSDIVTIVISYSVMFAYVSLALGRYQSCKRLLVESQILLGLSGVLIVLAAVSSSLGLFSYFGMRATLIAVEVIPFLVLAVGVDNIFILVQSYQREEGLREESVEETIGRVMGKVAPSLLLAISSEAICFFLGSLSDMPAVHMFALLAGTALVIVFVLQISCFVSLLYLDACRQQSDRLDILCCVQAAEKTESNHPGALYVFFQKYYSVFLMKEPVRVAVMIFFAGCLCTSIGVVDKIGVGLDQKLAMPEDSFVLRYFEYMNSYLSVGPPVYFVVKSGYSYKDFYHQNAICSSYGCARESLTTQILQAANTSDITYIAQPASCWLDDYIDWSGLSTCCKWKNGTYCPSTEPQSGCSACNIIDGNYSRPLEKYFLPFLLDFLNENPTQQCAKGGHAAYKDSIQLLNNSTEIGATYFMTYHTILKTSVDYTEALRWARKIADNITTTIRQEVGGTTEVFPYSIFYVFYEQYLTMWPVTLKSLGFSFLAVFVMSFFFLGLNLHCALIIVLTNAMILLDLMGLMYFWNIELNGASLVNLVMAVGISVEFCSHITRAYTVSNRKTRQKRAQESLAHMGSSVLSGITFTKFGGIVVLAFAKSQIFQVYYFRMYLGIVLIGAAHGLVFLPVLLSIIGPAANPLKCGSEAMSYYSAL